MTRLFAVLPTIGFLLALYGVPAVFLAVAAAAIVVGFGLGYAAAVKDHRRDELEEFERMRRLYPNAATQAHDEIVAELKAAELEKASS